MKKIIAFSFLIYSISCSQSPEKNKDKKAQRKKEIQQIAVEKDTLQRDTIEFVSYNDDFDYSQLNGKKGKEEISYINDQNNDRSFLRGDLIAIEYKNDSIYIAGDGETPQNAEWIVSAKKIKDGKVSKFRKGYNLPIKYHYSRENEISSSYLDHLHQLAEYYIANSKNDLIKLFVKNKDALAYSVEKQIKENKEYYVLGIYTESEHKINTFQWLYIDPETDTIYEYDLPNDKLIKFP
ncbi:hypothetical protein NAL32_11795 [Chryseobacterium sp. Ch-15]|uniref:Uncharacterized protein n=1 Tax=Chryseobacterium muglaense TaxID=2893752 RepID=A0A9Q3YQK5_9FLAO|nr:hypothetical protein [Chryseobacterium muglaense]MBD3905223.1 hypothetical protein [Chryseobacterium muglaense]MCC9034071.1 hypothetical protein [Chryseobacterium muglaense]MCM2555064.1 hypothetical protein [Chryseobacterium muglaense]